MKSRHLLASLPMLALLSFVSLVSLASVGGCGGKKKPANPEPAIAEAVADAGPPVEVDAAPPAPKPLFERLGGMDAVKAVVDSFVENVGHDTKINGVFKKTVGVKMTAFKKNLVDQVCEVTGGPCKYAGKDMKTAHKGMKITEAQFDALVGDLSTALDEHKVNADDKKELLGMLSPLKEDIVEKKGAKK